MKKANIFGISILTVFLLSSISYQPLIADDSLIKDKTNVISNTASFDFDRLKEEYYIFFGNILYSNDDCECQKTINWRFPVICGFLYSFYIFFNFVMELAQFTYLVYPLLLFLHLMLYRLPLTYMYYTFNCDWLFP